MRACQLNRIGTEVVAKGTICPVRQPVRLRNRHRQPPSQRQPQETYMLDSTALNAATESAWSDFPHSLQESYAIGQIGLCFKAEGNAPSLGGRSDERCPNSVRLPDPIQISSRSCRIHAEDGAAVAIEEGRHAAIGDAVHVHRTVTHLVVQNASKSRSVGFWKSTGMCT
jgi:hypothetical protein